MQTSEFTLDAITGPKPIPPSSPKSFGHVPTITFAVKGFKICRATAWNVLKVEGALELIDWLRTIFRVSDLGLTIKTSWKGRGYRAMPCCGGARSKREGRSYPTLQNMVLGRGMGVTGGSPVSENIAFQRTSPQPSPIPHTTQDVPIVEECHKASNRTKGFTIAFRRFSRFCASLPLTGLASPESVASSYLELKGRPQLSWRILNVILSTGKF